MNHTVNEGFVNSRHRVFGAVLRPYSAAHLFALESSFWPGFADPRGTASFISICRRKIDRETCLPVGFPDKGMSVADLIRLALFISFPKYHAAAVAKCAAYLRDCNACAPVASIEKEGKKVMAPKFEGSHVLQAVIAGMKSGLTRFEAWSIPYGSLHSYGIHAAALKGIPIKILDPEEDRRTAEFFAAAQARKEAVSE